MTGPMSYPDARALDIPTASDADLIAAWHAHASQISYLEADDYGGDWKLVPPVAERARAIEVVIRSRGIERPTGTYLLSTGSRIEWETGDWSPGWDWKKAAAERSKATGR